ncbi:L-ascorbate metabolism protein UlaG (beta-lactamase superfamily) [Pseudoduganella flava]|uniref:L-ascorbate metabolism protein UlaG (Beta-lactamase superfamily) n=1 Tax=Pseudoduganella flava TaxID=871742 RepID=A0A562Q164_9BURK|nr:MBL fold metallo-hydrolase [Pseudoduganella flava]QGZ38103.1 MBL fold metallo-hydrolase [Pseudoduganella flava]TWI50383.1 L-ascorbate metabolism protein UlaG (beta-lactamase superfamily) [Pseudoduganella flava]
MTRIAKQLAIAAALAATVATSATAGSVGFQQIRNATVKITYGGTTFLVDPMLAKAGSYPAFQGTYHSELRNPTVELPLPLEDVMRADAVIVTHTHLDHWDDGAKAALPKHIPLFAQNDEDAASIRKAGFTDVRVLGPDSEFKGVRLTPVTGQHGTDQIMAALGERLGKTVGIVFRQPGHKTVYIAGDTIWTPQVAGAIAQYRPDVIVLNTGYARLKAFDGSIIMGKEDVERAYHAAPQATIIGSHMEALNHLTQTRQDLKDYVAEKGLDAQRVLVPADGEAYRF